MALTLPPNAERDERKPAVRSPSLPSLGPLCLFPRVRLRVGRGGRRDEALRFRPLERQLLPAPRTSHGRALRKHGLRDSSNYKRGSKRRALKWKMPASRIVERNGKINIYFSAEEKMSSVSERDGKFLSAPAGAGSSGGRVPTRRRDLWAFSKSPLSSSSVL